MKIYFDRHSQQFAVAERNPETHKVEVVDTDSSFEELLRRHDLLEEENETSEPDSFPGDDFGLEFDD